MNIVSKVRWQYLNYFDTEFFENRHYFITPCIEFIFDSDYKCDIFLMRFKYGIIILVLLRVYNLQLWFDRLIKALFSLKKNYLLWEKITKVLRKYLTNITNIQIVLCKNILLIFFFKILCGNSFRSVILTKKKDFEGVSRCNKGTLVF